LCQKPRRRTKKGTSLLCFNSFCRQPFFHKESPTNNNNSNAPTGKGNVIIIWFVTWPTYGRLCHGVPQNHGSHGGAFL
jgi:hypothetical protein